MFYIYIILLEYYNNIFYIILGDILEKISGKLYRINYGKFISFSIDM